MAEMLIDGAKLDACNAAEADAIRAKTGGTDPIPYDYENDRGFADAIAAIPSGGGSSLPSSVSEIAGGSFTLAQDTLASQISLPHTMATIPKRFVIWTEDSFDDASVTDTKLFAVSVLFSRETVVASGGSFAASYTYIYYRYSDKRLSVNNGNRTEAQTANYLGADFVKFADSMVYYQAGKTYKWLAWA